MQRQMRCHRWTAIPSTSRDIEVTGTAAATGTTERRCPRLQSYIFAVLAASGVVSCGGDSLLLPSAGQPAQISVFRGDGQTGTVGQPLADSLVVLVTDPEERPVEGVEVAFMPPPGATLSPKDTVLTGPDGHAAVYYTLSTAAGDQTVEARAKPAVPSTPLSTLFHASAQPETATTLVAAAGDAQTAQTATALPESLAVRAVDRFGNGVGGVEVTWDATGGTVSPATVVTGSDGRAAVERTLGPRPGPYPTAAAAAGLEGSPISFAATGIAPPSPQLVLVTQPSATAKAGVALSSQPVLQLQDPVGAPLTQANVVVTVQIASGTGSLGGRTSARSDGAGRVSFTDLSIRGEPGERTLIFAATDFSPATSDPIGVAAGPPASGRSSASVENGTAGATTAISVRLQDEFGTPVQGAAGAIAISVDGANQVSNISIDDRGNGTYAASYVPLHSGTDQVTVRVSGTPLSGSPFASTVAAGPVDPSSSTAVVTRTDHFFFLTIDAVVTTRDAQGNTLGHGGDSVEIQLDNLAPQAAFDNGNGTYTSSIPTFTADHTVRITVNGSPIAGSPFTPTN